MVAVSIAIDSVKWLNTTSVVLFNIRRIFARTLRPATICSGWGWGRPTREEEKEYLDEYIEMLKEELAAAEG